MPAILTKTEEWRKVRAVDHGAHCFSIYEGDSLVVYAIMERDADRIVAAHNSTVALLAVAEKALREIGGGVVISYGRCAKIQKVARAALLELERERKEEK